MLPPAWPTWRSAGPTEATVSMRRCGLSSRRHVISTPPPPLPDICYWYGARGEYDDHSAEPNFVRFCGQALDMLSSHDDVRAVSQRPRNDPGSAMTMCIANIRRRFSENLCGWRLQVLLTGRGKNFCAGIDLSMAAGLMANWRKDGQCPGRAAERSRREILRMQDSLTACERCRWPVIAAVHGTRPVLTNPLDRTHVLDESVG